MRKVLIDYPSRIGREEYNMMLLEASIQRREKVESFKFFSDRVQSALAYHLLKKGLFDTYGIDIYPEFIFNGNGKPYLKDYSDIYFSLSHCAEAVICAIDDREIGIDVEIIPNKLDLDECKFCYNETEILDILMAQDPCVQFTKWWTMKESFLKLSGIGLVDDLPAVFSDSTMQEISFDVNVILEKRIVYSICQYHRDEIF